MNERHEELPERLRAALEHASQTGSEPRRDLWPGIEQRLEPRHRQRRWPALAAAAAILVALLLGVAWRLGRAPSGPSLTPSARPMLQTSNAELRELVTRHRSESERLLRLVNDALARHPQRVSDDVRGSLEALDAALANLEDALAEAPDRPQLESRLAGLYEQHLQVLRSLDGRLQGRRTSMTSARGDS